MKKSLFHRTSWIPLAVGLLFILVQAVLTNPTNLRAKRSSNYILSDCEVCMSSIDTLKFIFHKKYFNHTIVLNFIKSDCDNLPPTEVCHKLKDKKAVDTVWALADKNVSSYGTCNFFLDDVCLPGRMTTTTSLRSSNKTANRSTTAPAKVKRRLKILHLSGVHFDPNYDARDCAGGKWGCLGRHPPRRLLKSAFQHINETHKDIDFIFWTGDVQPWELWEGSLPRLRKNYRSVLKLFRHYLNKIHFYPSVGIYENLDSILDPTYNPQANNQTSELMKFLLLEWSEFLLNDGRSWGKNVKSILRGGWYSFAAKPGLRVISVNGNHCNRYNLRLALLDRADSDAQLAWLANELETAERANEKVVVLDALPPGNPDCDRVCSRGYHEIINRYEATIVAQFYGSSAPGARVFYDEKDVKRPVSVGYAGSSLSPVEGRNPAYTILYLDGYYKNTTWELIDMEMCGTDLIKANQNPDTNPTWSKIYDARKSNKLPSLLPIDWAKHVAKE